MRCEYEYNGKTYDVDELAELAGVSSQVMSYRLSVCRTVDEAVHFKRAKTYEYNGGEYTAKELAEIRGVTKQTFYWLLKRYGDIEKVMSARKYKRRKTK